MTRPRVFSERCSTCVFHPGNRMSLAPGRLKDLIDSNVAGGAALICHQTTYGQHPEIGETVCRGFYDAVGEGTNVIRVMNRLGGFEEVDPPGEGRALPHDTT